MDVVDRKRAEFAKLLVSADRGLDGVRRAQRGAGRVSGESRGLDAANAVGLADDKALRRAASGHGGLGIDGGADAVLLVEREDVATTEAVIEETKATTNDGFGRLGG